MYNVGDVEWGHSMLQLLLNKKWGKSKSLTNWRRTICWSTQCVLHTMCFTHNVFYKHNVLYAQCILHISWLSAEIGMKVRIVFESCSFFVLLQYHLLILILLQLSAYPHHQHLLGGEWSSLFTGSGEVLAVLAKIWYFMPQCRPDQPTAILLLTIFANILLLFSWCFLWQFLDVLT